MRVFARIFWFLKGGAGEGRVAPESFEALAAAYSEPTRMWLILLGIGRADAEDIVQNSLLALWERREQVPPEARPRWFRTAISLRIREHWRSRAIRDRILPPADADEADSAPLLEAGPDTRLGDEELAAFVRRLIDELPPERRDVVVLYLLEDRPIEEVAAILGTSVSTTWDRWTRARRELLARLRRARARERFGAGFASFVLLLLLQQAWTRLCRYSRSLVPAAACILAAGNHAATPHPPPGEAILAPRATLVTPPVVPVEPA